MNKTTERLADLSPEEQRALLAQLMRDRGPQPKLAPLTLPQERIWFLNQVDPESSAFNMAVAVRLTGRLNVDALQRGLGAIVRRHETLRTTFALQDGHPVQIITPVQSVPLPVVDLRPFPAAEREARAGQWIVGEVSRPFDLARGPLLRSTLLRLEEEEHVLTLNVHHIISDGWSQAVLLRELTLFYKAFVNGQPASLPDLPLQYAEFARWQREALDSEALAADLAYWQQQLAGPLPVLELVSDLPHGTAGSSAVVRQSRTLPRPLSEAVKAFSRQQGVTLFTTLLAAFKVLLHRYTGQTDIVVGSPIAGRDRAEVEGLIGLFIDTLVLRTRLDSLSDDPTFLELLEHVRQVVLDGLAHRALSFGQLVEALQPARDLNRNPLFQVVFVLQNLPSVALDLPGLQMEPFPIELQTAEAADLLGIAMQDTDQGITGLLECQKGLLVQGILDHLQVLLESIVADPHQRLSELSFLTRAERHQLLVDWNDTSLDYPQDRVFQQLFERQVKRTPDAIAAVFGEAHLSYHRLNQRANRLARRLVERGVGPDTVVALLASRSLNFVTAILAVFKAGGAYLPLDPRHPAQRLRQIVEQSRSPLVLTSDELFPVITNALSNLPPRAQPMTLRLSEALQPGCPEDNLPIRNTPRNLAYVIYTSGSTGLPKGAMLEQRGMLNHMYAKIHDLQLAATDVVAQNASQCFDISVWQFLTALLVGGCVQIYPDEIAHDPVRLLTQVASQRVTILEIVPALLRAMLERVDSDPHRFDMAALRWLMPTGEALSPGLARQWLHHYPNTTLINAYGPTECSDDVTHYPFNQPPAAEAVRIPIGRALNNLQLYVLDAHLRPVPVGVAGELYVGGDGVGRGYLHEPRKTAMAFLPDPFSPLPGTRFYKSGDLACYRPDGNLEFLGRIDHQVKVRGFRIELGEIEAALSRHPAVRETVVLAREDAPGEKRLVAYLVPRSGEALSSDDLRGFAGQQLPDYMLPSAFVRLDAMPLTPNGKINRRALPPPDPTQFQCGEEFVPPKGPVEEKLATIWHEFLAAEQIGIYDSFFDLGGHSLSATQVIYRINQAFQMELPVRSIFEDPTIAGLALLIKETFLQEIEQELERESAL